MKKIIIGILMVVLAVGVCLATVGCGEESLSGEEESLPGDWRGTRDETYSVTLTSPTHYINVDTGEYLGMKYHRYNNVKNIYSGEYRGEKFYFCDGWYFYDYIIEETGFFLGEKVNMIKPGGYEFEYATIPYDTAYTNQLGDKWVYRWTGDLGNTGVAIEGTNNGYLYAKNEIENLTQLSNGVFSVRDDEGELKHILAGSINYTNYTATLPLSVSETCVWRFLETGECFIHYVQKFSIDTGGTPSDSEILGDYKKEGVIETYQKGTYSILEDKVIAVLTFASTDGIKYAQTEQQTIYQLSLNKKNLEFSYPGVSYTVDELTDFAPYVVCYKTT